MIYSWAKSLGVTPEHVLFEMSYKNLLLYSAAIPQYDDEEDEWDPKLDANNPVNFRRQSDTTTTNTNNEYEDTQEVEEEEEFIKEY